MIGIWIVHEKKWDGHIQYSYTLWGDLDIGEKLFSGNTFDSLEECLAALQEVREIFTNASIELPDKSVIPAERLGMSATEGMEGK